MFIEPLASIIRNLFPKDNFAGDWYGWLTNQISHIALGVFIAIWVAGLSYLITGEFPVKWAGWLSCAGIYAVAEVVRGWNGVDTVEDWTFVSVYGAGGGFMAFSEVTPGEPLLVVSLGDVVFLLSFMVCHLIVGVLGRSRND